MKKGLSYIVVLLAVFSSCKQAHYTQLHMSGISLAHADEQKNNTDTGIKEVAFKADEASGRPETLEKLSENNKPKQQLSIRQKSIALVPVIRQAAAKATPKAQGKETPGEKKPVNKTSLITGLISLILAMASILAFISAFFTLAISGTATLALITFVLSLLAFISGIIALVSAKPDETNFIGFAVPGVALGGIMFLLSLVLGLIVLLLSL